MSNQPTHGFTAAGHAVHGKTIDHLPAESAYARFNKRVAVAVTERVGTMTCAWLFCLIALLSLPATLAGFKVFSTVFPKVLVNQHLILLIAWIAQTFIQLVLLAVIMVGQSVQSLASDARAARTFEDTERIVDLLDLHTEGGMKEILDAVKAMSAKVPPPSPGNPPIPPKAAA